MNIQAIVDTCSQRGVSLFNRDGKLGYRSRGGLHVEIRQLLTDRKAELLEYLQRADLEEILTRINQMATEQTTDPEVLEVVRILMNDCRTHWQEGRQALAVELARYRLQTMPGYLAATIQKGTPHECH